MPNRRSVSAPSHRRRVARGLGRRGEVEGDFGEIVRLLILMGQRETGALADRYYSHNQQTVTLPPELTKNNRGTPFRLGRWSKLFIGEVQLKRENALPFPAKGSDLPFSGWSKCKKALDKLANIAPWTLHDLRRTFRTNLGRLKVRPDIAERLVNHASARTELERNLRPLHITFPKCAKRWRSGRHSCRAFVSTSQRHSRLDYHE